MQIVTRSLQTVSQALAFTGQKLSQIDVRIAKTAALIFAAVVLYVAYRRISLEVDRINADRQQEVQDRRNALTEKLKPLQTESKRLGAILAGGIPAAIEESKSAVRAHLLPVHVEEKDYVNTLGSDESPGLKIPKHIANIFAHGEYWHYNSIRIEHPLSVYRYLSKDIGQEKANRCLNVCSNTAWQPTVAPLVAVFKPEQANVKEVNIVTVNDGVFKVMTVIRFLNKSDEKGCLGHVRRTIQFALSDLDSADGKMPSLSVEIQYPKINQ